MTLQTSSDIAIVGAGFSGTLVAAHLLRRARSPLTIHLIERNPRQFGRGVAYGTEAECHLLNVPAGNMSAFPDDRESFLRWAKAREADLAGPCVAEVTAASFLPRRAYGEYLRWVLDEAEQGAGPDVRLERRIDEVVDLRVEPDGVALVLAGGETLHAGRAVLALGNFPPGNPRVADPGFYGSARYHGNPWAPETLDAVLRTESCLLIGSGLTMVDWAVTLNQAGYHGQIHVLSRRGLWPEAHQSGPAADFAIDVQGHAATVRSWLHLIHRALRAGAAWRSVIDALRPATQTLWTHLPLTEQRRFLRHLRPFWDLHRHRLAPGIAARLAALVESGQVVRHVGRLLGYGETAEAVEVRIRPRNAEAEETLRVAAVINCSGSESNYRKLDVPLVKALLDRRLATPDPLALGLNVAPGGALIDATGNASSRLFTLGPPKKGLLWETTAVPEIRVQAARLAALLLHGQKS